MKDVIVAQLMELRRHNMKVRVAESTLGLIKDVAEVLP